METNRLLLQVVIKRPLPRRKQSLNPTEHALLKVPEELKLTEDKTVHQQQHLIGREDGKDVERNPNPGRRFGGNARQFEQRPLNKQHRKTSAGEYYQN